jgi:hypothetical protein
MREFDKDLLKVARDVYKARRDYKHGGARRWRELQAQHPELAAEASKPKPSKFTGNSKGYEPYNCWGRDSDRGRWHRTRGAQPDDARSSDDWESSDYSTERPEPRDNRLADRNDDPLPTGGSLLDLHVSTNGGYLVPRWAKVSNPNQLEVCRVCGSELKLSRDAEGFAYRDTGNQPQYCSDRCKNDVHNARKRAKRRGSPSVYYGWHGGSVPDGYARPDGPDLSTVSIAGIGELGIDPAAWNRVTPRRDADAYGRLYPNGRREGHALPALGAVEKMRRRPVPVDRTTRQDRIARRYGTGGTPKPPELAPDWDRVTSSYRYVPRSAVDEYSLDQLKAKVWRISRCITA